MYIPRPAKLLFQYDDGWNLFIENNHVDEWQLLSVEKMLACSTCAMGVRRYCCSSPECSHSRFFVKPVNPKPACVWPQRHRTVDCPAAPYFAGLRMATYYPHYASPALAFLTITGACSTNSFAVQPAPCSNTPSAKASKLAFYCAAYLRSPTQSTSAYSFIRHAWGIHSI
ncbi:hypothetical protein ArsFIN_32560 [Arsenophonus nasoniae]|uniref:Transposase zinc-binding domain-containing protein n=1 Tax=Arsenophonus nasoniae TaxID=638 RepID=A0A4P7L0W2_9GAMM|nr:transposase zinc-binding domain-containing protein [Arsenophonus nasoniae]QBY44670.1 hypothetical protein ArsFIN_32560 [Arsenophonus nasoniae]